jgi:hypothetical protein
VSIAAVALEHRLNANLLRRWVVTEERAKAGESAEPRAMPAHAVANAAFVPVDVPTPMTATTHEIVIELRRGATAIKVTWPLTAATACAAWGNGCGDPHRCRLAAAAAAEDDEGTAIAKAINYSLGRWPALTCFLDDGTLPIEITGSGTAFAPSRLAARTGSLPDRCAQASRPPPS